MCSILLYAQVQPSPGKFDTKLIILLSVVTVLLARSKSGSFQKWNLFYSATCVSLFLPNFLVKTISYWNRYIRDDTKFSEKQPYFSCRSSSHPSHPHFTHKVKPICIFECTVGGDRERVREPLVGKYSDREGFRGRGTRVWKFFFSSYDGLCGGLCVCYGVHSFTRSFEQRSVESSVAESWLGFIYFP